MSSGALQYLTLIEDTSYQSDYYIQQATNNATNIEYTYRPQSNGHLGHNYGHPRERINTIVLYNSGCRQGDTWNCTAACLDEVAGPNITWTGSNASYTIQNCLVYPIIATAAAYGWLEEKPPGLLNKYAIITNQTLPIEAPDTKDDYNYAWPVIRNCMQQFCFLLNDGEAQHDRCRFRASPELATNYSLGPPSSLWSPKLGIPESFCDLGPLSLNADLAGPGILVAYVQQLAILLGAMVLFNIAVFPSRFALFVLRRCHNGRDHTTSGRTKRVLELLAFPKLTASLLTALMGFQKTQIMLALVTQITTIIALRDPSLLAAATPLQMNFVRHYLYLINTSIILAVSFGILLLRKGTKRVRPQIQLASACSIFMGMATALILWFMNVNFYQHRQDPPETHRTLQCGGVNPMQHCEVPQEVFGDCSSPHITDLRDDKYTTGLNLTLSRAGFFIRFGAIIWTVFLLAGVALAGGAHPKKSYRRLEDGYYFICEVLFSWIMYSTISTLLSINRDDAFAAGRSWSIGQILAVMVWTPALIEWLYLIWVGLERGANGRIPTGYHVVQDDKDGTSTTAENQSTQASAVDIV